MADGPAPPLPVMLGRRKRVEGCWGVSELRRACRCGGELILHVECDFDALYIRVWSVVKSGAK